MAKLKTRGWTWTIKIIFADLRLLISFYAARFMVRRTLVAQRKTAQKNFKGLKKMREAEDESMSSLGGDEPYTAHEMF